MSITYQNDEHRFNNSPLSKRLRSVQLYKEKTQIPSPPSTMKFTITNSNNENEAEREAHYNQMRKLENELKSLLMNVNESNDTITKLKADSTQYLKGDGDTSKVILRNYKLLENKLPGMKPFQLVATKLDSLIMTVASIQKFRDTLDLKVADMQRLVRAEVEDIKIVKQEVSEDLDQIQTIDDRVSELEESVEKLLNAKDDLDDKTANKEYVLAEKKEILCNVNGTIKMVNNQLRNVGVGLDDYVKSNNERVTMVESQVNTFVKTTEEYHRSQSKSTEDMNTNMQMTVERISNQITEMRSKIENLEKQNSILKNRNNTLEEAHAATLKKVEELEQFIYYMNEEK